MLRFIFIAILFFFLLRLVLKVFALGNKRRSRPSSNQRSAHQKRKEGEMHIDYTPDQDQAEDKKKDEGEFIDYEEIQ